MSESKAIYINQIGYCTNSKKIGYIKISDGKNTCINSDKDFYVKDLQGNVQFSGKLTEPEYDEMSDETVCLADFSEFKKQGEFILTAGDLTSFKFKIGSNIYDDLYYSTLNYFYLSRCGQDIEAPVFGHKACHCGTAEIYGTNLHKTVLGGWHDAGDYGRYIVAGAKTVMDLLLAYEAVPDYSRFNILDEVRFELDWMLQLQREDGAVYHKISCYRFCGFIVPEKELDKLVIAPVSTSATADFAGCLAYASIFYKKSDSAYAEKLLMAAEKAQKYLDCHEDELYTNPKEITTGSYGDLNVKDERYFALCGLFAATGKNEYLEKAKLTRKNGIEYVPENKPVWFRGWSESFGWGSFAGYGSEILLKNQKLINDKDFIEELKRTFIAEAENLVDNSGKEVFGYCNQYIGWGSNGAICDSAHILNIAAWLTDNSKYKETAGRQLDYILGCNPMNNCYVTGNGTCSTMHPHHRPSGALGQVMPGMLAGGPDSGLHDADAKKELTGKAPLKCYLDKTPSYSTNEVAIYWNSALVYLIALNLHD